MALFCRRCLKSTGGTVLVLYAVGTADKTIRLVHLFSLYHTGGIFDFETHTQPNGLHYGRLPRGRRSEPFGRECR